MTVKIKNSFIFILLAVFIGIITYALNISDKKQITASAETISTSSYQVTFGYTHYLIKGSGIFGLETIKTQGEGDFVQVQLDEYSDTTVSMIIYGNSILGTDKTQFNGSINSNTITIEIDSDFYKYSLSIYGGGDIVAESSTKKLTASGLIDGYYIFNATLYGGTWVVDANTAYQIRMTCSFIFLIDSVSPTIDGASTSETANLKNGEFSVTAFDESSGVKNLYMQAPNSDRFVKLGETSVTINNKSANGRYVFYAEDFAGNVTQKYYVNFDDTAPTLESFGIWFGGTTSDTFSVMATDNTGIPTLYYKIKNGNWKISGNKFILPANPTEGIYYFYAIDSYGNKSEEKWIEFGTELYGEFIKSDKDNSVYFTWKISSWTATLDGKSYTNGTWIKTEGEHTIKLSSGSRSAIFSHTIDHYYIEKVNTANCTESGYTEFTCIQCGDTYKVTSSEEMGHYYVASTVSPTCTTQGYTTYTCTRCGDMYKDNETPALGHNYVPTLVSSTCTEGGYTLYKCSRCSSEYTSGNTYPAGHNYKVRSFPATCVEGGYALYECNKCGDSYRDNISQPLGHNFVKSLATATCTESGKTIYHCQICGYEKYEMDGTYPTGHNYTSYIVKESSCIEEGLRRSICDSCGDVVETKIAPNGHNYEITDTSSNDDKTVRTYTCSVCGDSYTQELGNQYEEVANYIEYLFEQYRPYMVWVLIATAGVWSIAIGVCIAIAHRNEDKAKAKKMLINYVIGLVIIFIIIVACPFLIRGIAALVT